MRAYVLDVLGQPGTVRELPAPEPGEGEVLVRMAAAGLNAFDVAVVSGQAQSFLEHRLPLVPGLDGAGVVERVGPGVAGLAPGDRVFGMASRPYLGSGTVAEMVALPMAAIALTPSGLDALVAAALPTAGLTALAALESLAPQRGQAIAILGATGGVGSYATQLAARSGATVITLSRPEHQGYARDLGATEALDYTQGDPAAAIRSTAPGGLDGVLDFAADAQLTSGISETLRPGGTIVATGRSIDPDALAERGLVGRMVRAAGPERLPELAGWLVEGTLRAPALEVFPLDRAREAFALMATRHAMGKVVVALDRAPREV